MTDVQASHFSNVLSVVLNRIISLRYLSGQCDIYDTADGRSVHEEEFLLFIAECKASLVGQSPCFTNEEVTNAFNALEVLEETLNEANRIEEEGELLAGWLAEVLTGKYGFLFTEWHKARQLYCTAGTLESSVLGVAPTAHT